jgi:hypothetical protein
MEKCPTAKGFFINHGKFLQDGRRLWRSAENNAFPDFGPLRRRDVSQK